MGSTALAVNLYAVEGRFPAAYTYATMAILFVWGGSIFLRYELERNRLAMARETVERHRAEEQLRRSEKRFALAVNGANDGLWDWNLQTNEMYFSPRWKAILGYRDNEIGHDPDEWYRRIHPDDAERVLVELRAHLRGQLTHYENEHRLEHKDGTYRWVLARGLVARDGHGPANRMAGSLTDITNRKETEEQLLQATAEAQAILRALPDWYFRLGADGALLDYHAPELSDPSGAAPNPIGKQFPGDIFPERVGRRFRTAIRNVLENHSTLTIEYAEPSANGQRFFEARFVPLRGSQIIAIIRDVTKQRQATVALEQQTAELARSNAELQQFAYVASHDLQEPLRMVASYVQLLGRRYRERLDADADEFIRYAAEGAGRMQALINDLLTYSRVGTHGRQLESTDSRAALQRALSNLEAAITEKAATITSDALPEVSADRTQLVQLFQNLVGNAIKFQKADAPRVHVAARANGKEWVFSVRDNGIGIDEKFAARIFAIFQRLHSRKEYSGTGIGLAICKKIVERHGGRIWVESSPGEGSTFYFTMPVRKGEGRDEPTRDVPAH